MAEGMMTLLLLLADVMQDAASGVDSLSGHAGWFGAGLLGAVLSWLLLVHLPSKDKQLKDFIESKDKQMETKDAQIMTVLTQKWESIQILSANYQVSLKEIVAHCEKEMRDITVEWKEDIDKLISKFPSRSN